MRSPPSIAAYEDRGEGHPVLLVHSFPLDRRMWAPQVEALAHAGFRAISIDLPGFGQTPLAAGVEPSLEVYASAVIDLLDHLRIECATVLGLSLGGYVALRVVARASERVEALVLADTRATGDSPQVRASRLVNLALVRERGAASLTEKMLPHLLGPRATEVVKAEVRAIGGSQTAEGVTFALLAMRDRGDATELLSQLRQNTLVLVGEFDAITPPAEMRRLSDTLPGGLFVLLSGCAHLSSMESPDAFNVALLDFLVERRRAASR